MQCREEVAGRGRVTRRPDEGGEIRPGGEGGGVPGSENLLADGEQRRVLVAGRGRVTRRPGEAGETRPGGEGGGVPGSENLLRKRNLLLARWPRLSERLARSRQCGNWSDDSASAGG
jgi:hypothetical protein